MSPQFREDYLEKNLNIHQWLLTQLAELLDEPIAEIATLSINEDLLSYGLDSIRLMFLHERLRQRGILVNFAELSSHPTLANWQQLITKVIKHNQCIANPTELLPTHPIFEPFELSPVQQAYWYGREKAETLGNISCHAFLIFKSRSIDPIRLKNASQLVQQRHWMLQTAFNDGLQQVQTNPFTDIFDYQNWQQEDLAKAQQNWQTLKNFRSHQILDIRHGEVFKVGLVKMPNQQDYVWLSLDLLAADVESLRLLLKELGNAYSAPELLTAAPTIHFADYLTRRLQRISQQLEASKAYWQVKLTTLPSAPSLPLAVSPDSITKPHFSRQLFHLSLDNYHCLEQQAASYGLTPSSIFGCAFSLIIGLWSESPNFLLNIPLFDRHDEDPAIKDVLADFTTLLLIECGVTEQQSFANIASNFQKQLHQAITYSAFPAIEILREARKRGLNCQAPVVFSSNLGKEPFIPTSFSQTFGDLYEMISQTPQVWLDFQLYRLNKSILIAWDSVDGLFAEHVINHMFQSYVTLIQKLCHTDWQIPINLSLPLSQLNKRQHINYPVLAIPNKTLFTDFYHQANKDPNAIALIENDHLITRGELLLQALKIAGALDAANIIYGNAVAVSLPRGSLQIATVMAIVMIGACYVPIDLAQPETRRHLIEKSAGIHAIITTASIQITSTAPLFYIEQLIQHTPLAAPLAISPEASAYVIYTSGSTGTPKGVEMSHKAAINTITAITQLLNLNTQDALLTVSALDFDLSVFDVFGLLGAGARLVIVGQQDNRDANQWADLIAKHHITIWNSAPALLEMLLALPEQQTKLSSLRAILVSGDWIALDLAKRIKQRANPQCAFYALGGATEAGIWSNIQQVDQIPVNWHSIPYGKPLPNQAYRVINEYGHDVPDYVIGEILIGGDSLANGYRHDPKLTSQHFLETDSGRWYKTGDRGRYWSDGTLEFLGRIDQQVKIKGQRIELGEIEATLTLHPAIDSACALAIKEKSLLAAIITPALAKEPIASNYLAKTLALDSTKLEARITIELVQSLSSEISINSDLRNKWQEWLKTQQQNLTLPLDEALTALNWTTTDLITMQQTIKEIALQNTEANLLLLDKLLAPQAIASQLPETKAILAQLKPLLDPLINNVNPLKIAILDCKAGQLFKTLLSWLDHPNFEVTLFDQSAALIDEATKYFSQITPHVQILPHQLLASQYLCYFDIVISFVALHTYQIPTVGLQLSELLLKPQGNLLLIELTAPSPLSLISAELITKEPPKLTSLPAITSNLAATYFTINHLYQSYKVVGIWAQKNNPHALTDKELNCWLTEHLPEAMKPEKKWLIPTLPLNNNGKIDRKLLLQWLTVIITQQTEQISETDFIPENSLQTELLNCWQQILKTSINSKDSSFFNLGGDSLLATRLLVLIKEKLAITIRMPAFYKNPTIAGMLQIINEKQKDNNSDITLEEGVI